MGGRYILILWATLVLVAVAVLGQRLQIVNDVALFLPQERDEDQHFLLQQLRQGAGASLTIVTLSGAETDRLVEVSQHVGDALRQDSRLRRVINGPLFSVTDTKSTWYRYRLLLSPATEHERFTANGLQAQLQERLVELASPMGVMAKTWLRADPIATYRAWLERLPRPQGPQLRHGVWFDQAGTHAILWLETHASGFDLEVQQSVITRLRETVAAIAPEVKIDLTGSGVIGVATKRLIQSEIRWLSLLAAIALLVILTYNYRSLRLLILAGLPLVTGILTAMATTTLIYGEVHGIALAFGVTILGVAVDYPLHLLSHLRRDQAAISAMRDIWPTLRLGVLSTIAGYTAMFLSGFPGLAQLALFACCGLLGAAATVRWVLPALLPSRYEVVLAETTTIPRRQIGPRLVMVLALLAVGITAWIPKPIWSDGLTTLSPIADELRQRDAELRHMSGSTEFSHLLLIPAPSSEMVLRRCEEIRPALVMLSERGDVAGFEAPCDYLPSQALQAQRQATLPTDTQLREQLAIALEGLPFKSGVFEPFIENVEESRHLPLLDVERVEDTALGPALTGLLQTDAGASVGVVRLVNVQDEAAIQSWVGETEGVRYLHLRRLTDTMMSNFRSEILGWLALGFAIIIVLLWVGLGHWRAALQTLLPLFASLAFTVMCLQMIGESLSLFHLVALMLVAGIGLDYTLFFRRAALRGRDVRTMHALRVCAMSTVTVFGMLAFSAVPVLRAIGLTVALGVVSSYFVARHSLYTREKIIV